MDCLTYFSLLSDPAQSRPKSKLSNETTLLDESPEEEEKEVDTEENDTTTSEENSSIDIRPVEEIKVRNQLV